LGDRLAGLVHRRAAVQHHRHLRHEPGGHRDLFGGDHTVHGGRGGSVVRGRADAHRGLGCGTRQGRCPGVTMVLALTSQAPLTPSADEAQQWARTELAKAIYNNDPTLLEQVISRLKDLWQRLQDATGSLGPVATPLIVVGILVLILLVGFLIAGPVRRRRRGRASAAPWCSTVMNAPPMNCARQPRAQPPPATAPCACWNVAARCCGPWTSVPCSPTGRAARPMKPRGPRPAPSAIMPEP